MHRKWVNEHCSCFSRIDSCLLFPGYCSFRFLTSSYRLATMRSSYCNHTHRMRIQFHASLTAFAPCATSCRRRHRYTGFRLYENSVWFNVVQPISPSGSKYWILRIVKQHIRKGRKAFITTLVIIPRKARLSCSTKLHPFNSKRTLLKYTNSEPGHSLVV